MLGGKLDAKDTQKEVSGGSCTDAVGRVYAGCGSPLPKQERLHLYLKM